MDEKELQEFDLDDIIKEFSDSPTEEIPVVPEDDDMKVGLPPKQEKAVQLGDTIRLDTPSFTTGQVRNAEPIEEEELQPESEQEQEDPFSNAWEPEYEQPIAEYVPPQPIAFRPKSRLQELKRKLVAGPEKQYYALSEKGLGKLQLAIFVSLLIVLLSAATTVAFAVGWIAPERTKLMVFIQFMAMMLSALLGSFQLIEGVSDLFQKRFSLNTLLVFTFIFCCIDGILCFKQQQIPCCAAFSLEMTMSLWSAYQRRNAQLGQLDTMRKANRLDGITAKADYYEGMDGFVRTEGQVEDFTETWQQPTGPDKVLSIYAVAALAVSVGIGITAAVLHSVTFGIRVAAVTLLAAMPATIFITVSRPFAILVRRLHSIGTVLCGWKGIKALCKTAVFPVKHDDLFPIGTVKLNGVKFFSDRNPDVTVAYAAALVAADDGGMVPLFTHLLDSRNGIHYQVENYRTYEDDGIGGEINGEPVLMGSLSFLKAMGVETPEGIRVGHAVCVAVDGVLCGLFAVTYEKNRASVAGMTTLCAYRGLQPIMVSNDFMLSEGFLRSKFGSGIRKMIFPEYAKREQLPYETEREEAEVLLMTTQDGLAPLAYGVTGARAFKTASTLGVIIHLIGGILGIGMMVLLAILGAQGLLTPINLFLYELIWMVPGLLITEWTRSI